MKLLRSWPAVVPPGRAHVVDGIDRLVMAGYDYTVLGDVDDDVLLLEWDIAVSQEELRAFAARAAADPGRVLAAPYRLYPGGSIRDPNRTKPVWSAWRYAVDQRTGGVVEVEPCAPTAHVVGLGMTYLPRDLIRRYLAERQPDWGFSDIAFSGWHHREVTPDIPLDWQARPVHLHYRLPNIEGGTS